MRIDRTHRPWLRLSLILLIPAAGWYIVDALHGGAALNGPSGASITGIVFGSIGLAFMIYAALLGARKRLRSVPLGRTQWWMRGHLWLGTLALFFVWLHAGFHLGGSLTLWTMILLYVVVASGWFGALLQHFLPEYLTHQVPNETIYDQIPLVLHHLQDEADDVAAICGPLNSEPLESWRAQRASAIMDRERGELITSRRREELLTALKAAPAVGSGELRRFYVHDLKPYIRGEAPSDSAMANVRRIPLLFEQKRNLLPEALHPALKDLEQICNERRQLILQKRIHHWLHGWLFVHIPISMALLALAVVHVFLAIKYSTIKHF